MPTIKAINFIFGQPAVFYWVMLYFSRSHVSDCGNVDTQLAALRNCRSQGHLGLAPVGIEIKQNKEQSVGIAAVAHANVLCTDL